MPDALSPSSVADDLRVLPDSRESRLPRAAAELVDGDSALSASSSWKQRRITWKIRSPTYQHRIRFVTVVLRQSEPLSGAVGLEQTVSNEIVHSPSDQVIEEVFLSGLKRWAESFNFFGLHELPRKSY